MPEVRMKSGDRLPILRMQLADSSGAAVDLTGATVSFVMGPRGGGLMTLTGVASVVTAASGVVEFAWGVGDLASAGVYEAEWRATWVNGRQTVPTSGYVIIVVEPAKG